MLLALTEGWSDAVAITGLMVTVAGFAVTLYQLRKTQSAAEAARAAAGRAFAESRRYVEGTIASAAHRYVVELRDLAGRRQWEAAARRMNDLADQLALWPDGGDVLATWVGGARRWATEFARLASGDLRRFRTSQWVLFLVGLQQVIDGLRPGFAPAPE